MQAVFALQGDKAPGRYGFMVELFRIWWAILNDHLLHIFKIPQIMTSICVGMNADFITLIPKVLVAKNIKEFRPINLTTSLQ